MKKIFLMLAISLINFCFAQNSFNSYLKEDRTYREHPLDITHMKVEVSFVPEKGLVKGYVIHTFNVLQKDVDSVFFDAPGITIFDAFLNSQKLNFKSSKTGVWVFPSKTMHWDEKGTISFKYEATPKRGIYFIGWNIEAPKEPNPFAVRKQIWTQGQGIDNRHWIPMYDDMNDKYVTETLITFDKEYSVLSNGLLQKKSSNKDNTNTWHYSMSKPHSGYLLMLAIGKYAVKSEKSKKGVPVNYWYYPEFAERAEPTFRYTPQMIDFMEKETGVNYPWESYSQVMVQDFLYGAMENTTATVFGDFFNVDKRAFLDRNYISVNVHELTHQWFGDFISARDNRDTWLQESYATYYPKQFSRVLYGEDEYNWQKRSDQNQAIEAGKKDNFPVRHTRGGSPRVYQKGSAVISMLSYVLGDEQWKRALNYYLNKNAYSNVETNDLVAAIKDKLGLNLEWFFDEWLYRGGEPHYRIHYEDLSYNDGTKSTEIAIEQIHQSDETVRWFKMPIVIEVHYTDGTFDSIKEMIESQFEVVKIPNTGKKKIAFVLFDPNSNILKQVTFKKTIEELSYQIENAKHYLDRYDAVVALRDTDINKKRNILLGAIKRETHYGIINEIVNQIIDDSNQNSVEALKEQMNSSKSSTRDLILRSLKKIDPSWKNIYFKALRDSSYDVEKTALDRLYNTFPSETSTFLEVTKSDYGMNNVLKIKWLEISVMANINREVSVDMLRAFASPQYEFRTRTNAFNALKNLNYFDEAVCESILEAMLAKNGRMSGPAGELMNHFSLQSAFKQLAKNKFEKLNYSDEQREIIIKSAAWLKK